MSLRVATAAEGPAVGDFVAQIGPLRERYDMVRCDVALLAFLTTDSAPPMIPAVDSVAPLNVFLCPASKMTARGVSVLVVPVPLAALMMAKDKPTRSSSIMADNCWNRSSTATLTNFLFVKQWIPCWICRTSQVMSEYEVLRPRRTRTDESRDYRTTSAFTKPSGM